MIICATLRNLVLIVKSKKVEKQPWTSVTFSRVAGWNCISTNSNTPPWALFCKNCKNDLKLHKASHLLVTYPLVRVYLIWLLVVYTKTPESSQPPLFILTLSWTVHKFSIFRLHMAIANKKMTNYCFRSA